MIRIRDIQLPPEHNAHQLQFEAAQLLKISPSKVKGIRIFRKSIDARKKPEVKIIYTVDVAGEVVYCYVKCFCLVIAGYLDYEFHLFFRPYMFFLK